MRALREDRQGNFGPDLLTDYCMVKLQRQIMAQGDEKYCESKGMEKPASP